MPQHWWGLTSLCCLVAPAQCLGGQYHHWQQGGAAIEPVSVTAALPGVLERHSAPKYAEHQEHNNGKKRPHVSNVNVTRAWFP